MGKIIRHEFLGNPLIVVLLCVTVIGIPLAIFYFLTSWITVVEELESPSDFLAQYRAGKFKK